MYDNIALSMSLLVICFELSSLKDTLFPKDDTPGWKQFLFETVNIGFLLGCDRAVDDLNLKGQV